MFQNMEHEIKNWHRTCHQASDAKNINSNLLKNGGGVINIKAGNVLLNSKNIQVTFQSCLFRFSHNLLEILRSVVNMRSLQC